VQDILVQDIMGKRVPARQRPARRRLALLWPVLCAALLAAQPARALDLSFLDPFGWFTERPPAVTPTTLPYAITITGLDGQRDARGAVEDVSLLYRLRGEPPASADELVRRAEADLPRVTDALWASGFYAARVSIDIAGATLSLGQNGLGPATAAAARLRGQALVPVVLRVEPGPVYSFRSVEVRQQGGLTAQDPRLMGAAARALPEGDVARTASLLRAEAALADRYRAAGYPFVRVERQRAVIDHPARSVDVGLTVTPGPLATLGPIGITGTTDVDPAVVRSFIYAEPGDPYSPQALADIRKSVSRIEALGSVRVREGETLDANGGLPLTVEVTERPKRLLGASARFSTTDGPALKAYWAHRNLFGGAERLRFDADLFYTSAEDRARATRRRDTFNLADLGGRFSVSFLKPALGGSRFDLLADAFVMRERTKFYTSRLANATVAVRRRFTDSFFVQGGIEGEIGQTSDVLGRFDHALVGLPLSVSFDNTDRPLDPTRGVRVLASIAPYLGFQDAPDVFGIGRVQASTYHALDEEARTVLAGRIAAGSIVGGDITEIPASRRFFVGGGGSVRGFAYKSLGPKDPGGRVIGGLSFVEASAEARIKITDTIGVVPFVDVGQAYAREFPDGSERLRVAAGLGLRYYTSIGPIRLDVATPLQRRKGDRPVSLYVSLGQAF
jgi:translocation and assembly module TamA